MISGDDQVMRLLNMLHYRGKKKNTLSGWVYVYPDAGLGSNRILSLDAVILWP